MSELQYIDAEGALCDVPLQTYPDTMPLVHRDHARLAGRYLLRPKSLASFMAAMFFFDALTERLTGFAPELVLPFVPGARQDRLNDTGDYLFTAKSIAKEINARGLQSVTILDPHSEVTPALIDRCKVVHIADFITTPPGKYAAVISPDAGAEKRAGAVAKKLGVPLIHAWKTRDVSTGAIAGFGFDVDALELPAVDDNASRVLVVDDICDGGGTFVGLAQAVAKEFDDQIDLHLFTTHGIYSKGVAPLAEHFSHVYCSDSILGDLPGAIEINVCEKLLRNEL